MIDKSRAALLGTIILLVFFSTQARADSLRVWVGYADSLRPSGFFPTPFAGTPGVVYSGLSTTFSLDSGAVRIDNTGGTSFTITNLTVTLNPGTGPMPFSLWSAPVTLAPGQKAIYAQTAQFNFDTSDFGFLGVVGIDKSHPLGGCTNPGALTALQRHDCIVDAPLVSFDENGHAVSYVDSGTVLNTFGYDFLYGSSDANESINWNVIGTSVNRGGSSATPEPSTLELSAIGLLCALTRRRIVRRS